MQSARFLLVLVLTLLPGLSLMAETEQIPVPNALWVGDNVLSGGQPTSEQLAAAAAAGYSTIINLRGAGEGGSIENEREQVEALGMQYFAIPIDGPEAFNRENVKQLTAHIDAAKGATLVHCASGNRIGVMFALQAFWFEGADAEAALETGFAKGMRRVPPNVSAILEAGKQD